MSPASSPDSPTASGAWTLMADDDVAVDLADEHHAGDVERLGVGDAQSVDELRDLAQPGHQLADLRAAAVHDERAHADRAHEHDVGRERGQAGVVGVRRAGGAAGGAGQGVAAVLDHHHLAPEAADVGQGLDQDGGLGGGAPRPWRSWVHPDQGQAGGLGQPEGQVGALDGLPGGALGQVVDGGDGHDPTGAGVVAGREVGAVRSQGRLGRR